MQHWTDMALMDCFSVRPLRLPFYKFANNGLTQRCYPHSVHHTLSARGIEPPTIFSKMGA